MKKTQRIAVRLSYNEERKLAELCARTCRNQSETLRELIREAPLPEPRQARLDNDVIQSCCAATVAK